jgi:hypothetical protein
LSETAAKRKTKRPLFVMSKFQSRRFVHAFDERQLRRLRADNFMPVVNEPAK